MRFLSLLLLLIPFIGSAAEPKPILSPQEIADGWLMLFDGESTFGWKIEGESEVKDGNLILGGKKATKAVSSLLVQGGIFRIKHIQQGGPTQFRIGSSTTSGRVIDRDPKEPSDHEQVIDFEGTKELAGVVIEVPAGSTCAITKLILRLQPSESLFNGKDLTGWKTFPGDKYKSVFSVTKEGWINVKNGPGDLQTEKQYDDFALKLDCYSNGKALNSGVFFRCLADQYQNGYEMQIQNGYKDGDRAKPADFGTGAIYRRVPARKVVSNDGEWFTMTLVAHGKHLRTFVNGYPTVDWTDDRKDSDNPRLGAKTGKGHLSIQGHDPTTDLNFRNIEIAELRK